MPAEQKLSPSDLALLSVKLHRKPEFVKKRSYLEGVAVVLDGHGLTPTRIMDGIIETKIGLVTHPVIVVNDTHFHRRIVPKPDTKVLGLTPEEWFDQKIVAINPEWANDAMVGDTVLQALLMQARFDSSFKVVVAPDIPQPALHAANHFLTYALSPSYRGNWYRWLEQGV